MTPAIRTATRNVASARAVIANKYRRSGSLTYLPNLGISLLLSTSFCDLRHASYIENVSRTRRKTASEVSK